MSMLRKPTVYAATNGSTTTSHESSTRSTSSDDAENMPPPTTTPNRPSTGNRMSSKIKSPVATPLAPPTRRVLKSKDPQFATLPAGFNLQQLQQQQAKDTAAANATANGLALQIPSTPNAANMARRRSAMSPAPVAAPLQPTSPPPVPPAMSRPASLGRAPALAHSQSVGALHMQSPLTTPPHTYQHRMSIPNNTSSPPPEGSGNDGTTIHVAVRVRPFLQSSGSLHDSTPGRCSLFVQPPATLTVSTGKVGAIKESNYTYDHVFGMKSTQDDVYEHCKPVVMSVLQDTNATIVAYGQTGSGKTHTMGAADGIVSRAVEDIYAAITDSHSNPVNGKLSVYASYLEIYNERVYDLLSADATPLSPTNSDSKNTLDVRESGDGSFYVEALTRITCDTPDHLLATIERGTANRMTSCTIMNAASSRSHSVLTITVERTSTVSDSIVSSAKLNLVDLAGSEKLTTAHDTNLGKETVGINLSLSTLASCIAALSAGQKHVPFRDSRLTRLLKDSLSGSARCLMIACVSPAESAVAETLSTLRYASRVKLIKKAKAIAQVDPVEQYIQALQQQLHASKLAAMMDHIRLVKLWTALQRATDAGIDDETEHTADKIELTTEATSAAVASPAENSNTISVMRHYPMHDINSLHTSSLYDTMLQHVKAHIHAAAVNHTNGYASSNGHTSTTSEQLIASQEKVAALQEQLLEARANTAAANRSDDRADALQSDVEQLRLDLAARDAELEVSKAHESSLAAQLADCHERMESASAVVNEMQSRLTETIISRSQLKSAHSEIATLKSQLSVASAQPPAATGCSLM